METSAGVLKILYRSIILGFIFLIILDRLNITITPFIASLGIGGLVIALALQETLANFFAGIYIFFDKPIRIGDYIMLESGKEGYVTQIGWRSTRIRMLPNNILIVPNAKLINSQITNFYLPETEMAVLVQVGVSYQSDLEKVERVTIDVAKQVLQEVEGGVKEFEPFIRYNTFGDFSINFTVILRAREYVDKYLITHEFIKRLHKRYQLEGIEIPFPIRTIYMKNEISRN
jgi:small-conductance mechanosensitive channel